MVGALLTDTFATQGVAINRPKANAAPPTPANRIMSKKLLLCAPSNAAVDEIVARLKGGVKTSKGEFVKINLVRLGRSDAVNINVKDVMLDDLVNARLGLDNKKSNNVLSEREKLHKEAGELKVTLAGVRAGLEEARTSNSPEVARLQREFDGLKRKQAQIGAKIDEDKDSGNTVSRQNEINKRRVQQEIIDGAHVICSTLSGAGHDMLKNLEVEFETVIIDEAAQCIELSALIPLKYGCSKCILVGDPKQLPPTVLSRSAARYGYEQSLFVRMQQNHPNDVHLLDTQYRMHPEISRFPSQQFYDSKLIDGEGMAAIRQQPWHSTALLGPYRFFDVRGVQANVAKSHSFINVEELNVAMQLYERLKTDFKSYDWKGKVGIITPYKAQLRELRDRFQRKYGEGIFTEVEFNTTDAFQGRESEVIIFSCVRARSSGGIGFLEDIRRMNVGLTRAKSSLWVLGNSQSLMQGEFWSKLITDAKERDRYTSGDVRALLSQRSTFISKPLPAPLKVEELAPEKEKSDVEMPDVSKSASSESDSDSDSDSEEEDEVDVKKNIINPAASIRQSATGNVHNITAAQPGLKTEPGVPSRLTIKPKAAPQGEPQATNGKRAREASPTTAVPLVTKKTRTDPIPDAADGAQSGKISAPPAKVSFPTILTCSSQTNTVAKPTPRPGPPLGVLPPRRKAPADPFIQRKKPPRRPM